MHPTKAQAALGWCSEKEGLNSQGQQKGEISWRLLTYISLSLHPPMGRTHSLSSSSPWHPGLWTHIPRISQVADEQGRMVLRQARGSGSGMILKTMESFPQQGAKDPLKCQSPHLASIFL